LFTGPDARMTVFFRLNALVKKQLPWMLARCSQFSPSYSQFFPDDSSAESEANQALQRPVFHDGLRKLLRISVVNNLVKSRE
jgi:hypothetical protein